MCADIKSVRNLYIGQCALVLDRALRTANCIFHTRVREITQTQNAIETWDVRRVRLRLPLQTSARVDKVTEPTGETRELWRANLLKHTPRSREQYEIASTFHTDADKIAADQELLSQLYTSQNAENWWQIGLQIPTASDRRPDCATTEHCNVARAGPPSMCALAPIVVGAPDAMRRFPDAIKTSLVGLLEREHARVPTIEIEATQHLEMG